LVKIIPETTGHQMTISHSVCFCTT